MLGQISSEMIEKFISSSPILAFLMGMALLQYKYLAGRDRRDSERDKRDSEEAERREKVWADLADSNKLTAVAGQKITEKCHDVIEKAAGAFVTVTANCEKLDTARQSFDRAVDRTKP